MKQKTVRKEEKHMKERNKELKRKKILFLTTGWVWPP
jgi:hypothetical protein